MRGVNMKTEGEELIETIVDVLNQACQIEFIGIPGSGTAILASSGISAYESALDLLVKLGRAEKLPEKDRWRLT